MSDMIKESREPSDPHRWRDQLGGQWLQNSPHDERNGDYKWRLLYAGGFIAFLWMLGHKADADGINRRPPGSEWGANASGTSRDSVRRYYNAAAALGVISLELSANGRYVRGYTLMIIPLYALNWEACLKALQSDSRRVRRSEVVKAKSIRTMREALAQSESARTDSPAWDALIESARADSPADEEADTAVSPDVRTPGNGTESARADSLPEPRNGTESARADSVSPHVHEVSPHVRTNQGSPWLYQDGADVVPQPADPGDGEIPEEGWRFEAPTEEEWASWAAYRAG